MIAQVITVLINIRKHEGTIIGNKIAVYCIFNQLLVTFLASYIKIIYL